MFGGLNGKLIGAYFKKYGWDKFQVLQDGGGETKVLTGWASPAGAHALFVAVDQAKNTALVVVPQLAKAPREDFGPSDLADILMALGFANYQLLLGKFSYDPADGEIRFEYTFPTDGAKMSYEQFAHIIRATTASVEYWAERITDACEGRRSGESLVESFLSHAQQAGV